MSRIHHLRPALTVGLALLGLSALMSHAAPTTTANKNLPDSFLPVQARSVAAIIAQVQSDPTVRRHYARYLHMPTARVAPYLSANLVLSRLGHEGKYTVYFVRSNGLIYPTVQTIARNSPVFALRNGPALLTWNEGDPLVRLQKSVHFDPYNQSSPTAPALPPAPPRVQQVIVPTRVETTVVLSAPVAPQPAAPANTGGGQ